MRAFVALLLAANLLVWAASLGWFDEFLGTPTGSAREPQRMAAQVNPSSLVVLSPQAASAAVAAAQAAVRAAHSCLEAGPFTADSVAAAEGELAQAFAADIGIGRIERQEPAVWIIYMGRYTEPGMLGKKQEELKRLRLVFEEVRNAPALQPGLSLGRFERREAAQTALDQMTAQGLRTARVTALSEAKTTLWLRAAQADPELATRMKALKSVALGNGFQPCPSP
jgi:hypothetical protein